jgi:hypothetical protein
MCVLRAPERLTGIENQTDGLGIDLSFCRVLGRGEFSPPFGP